MKVGAFIKSATFTDGTRVSFAANDIVVLLGPNNAGKSATLSALVELFQSNERRNSPVVTAVERTVIGTTDELLKWLEETSFVYQNPVNPLFSVHGQNTTTQNATFVWQSYATRGFGELAKFFCAHLTTAQRLETVKPPEAISLTSTAPQHPIHYLQRDDSIEKRVSGYFRQAFGKDVIVHHNSGRDVPLYIGDRPQLQIGEDRVSSRYLRELEKLPRLHGQGDGMRSFAGVVLHAIIGHHTTVLVDEPEAFLHPPQARLLGRMLAKETPDNRQLFIATHSADVLQGLLDANKGNIRVVRLTRKENINHVRELQTVDVQQIWSDPLLRHSNVLNGLFHEKVIVCESDSDCRFYAAVLDTLLDDDRLQRSDIMFVHCGGKGRIPTIVRALRAVGVPVCTVTDFDVLNDENPLRLIWESLGETWDDISGDWKALKASIESKKPDLSANDVRREIESILENIKDGSFPKSAGEQIQKILRRSSPWAIAKTVGKAFVPSGDPHLIYNRLIQRLENAGAFVVEVGELEGFARSVSGHGPQWVNGVLPKVAARDHEINSAREFVTRLVTYNPN